MTWAMLVIMSTARPVPFRRRGGLLRIRRAELTDLGVAAAALPIARGNRPDAVGGRHEVFQPLGIADHVLHRGGIELRRHEHICQQDVDAVLNGDDGVKFADGSPPRAQVEHGDHAEGIRLRGVHGQKAACVSPLRIERTPHRSVGGNLLGGVNLEIAGLLVVPPLAGQGGYVGPGRIVEEMAIPGVVGVTRQGRIVIIAPGDEVGFPAVAQRVPKSSADY